MKFRFTPDIQSLADTACLVERLKKKGSKDLQAQVTTNQMQHKKLEEDVGQELKTHERIRSAREVLFAETREAKERLTTLEVNAGAADKSWREARRSLRTAQAREKAQGEQLVSLKHRLKLQKGKTGLFFTGAEEPNFRQALNFIDRTQPIIWEAGTKLSWTTAPITHIYDAKHNPIEVNLGRFEIEVRLRVLSYGGTECNVTCSPINARLGRPVGGDEELVHPHITTCGSPCLGTYVGDAVHSLMHKNRMVELITLIGQYLISYNQADPYARLLCWAPNGSDLPHCECGRGEEHYSMLCPGPNCLVCGAATEDGVRAHAQCLALTTIPSSNESPLPRHVLGILGLKQIPSHKLAHNFIKEFQ